MLYQLFFRIRKFQIHICRNTQIHVLTTTSSEVSGLWSTTSTHSIANCLNFCTPEFYHFVPDLEVWYSISQSSELMTTDSLGKTAPIDRGEGHDTWEAQVTRTTQTDEKTVACIAKCHFLAFFGTAQRESKSKQIRANRGIRKAPGLFLTK